MTSSRSLGIFVSSTLDTRLAVPASPEDTIGDLKRMLEWEHPVYFPSIGEITVKNIEIEKGESQFKLLDSMSVGCLFDGLEKSCFLHMEAETAPQHAARRIQEGEPIDSPHAVPDYLCCKITLDIFTNPVVTPCGITYEKSAIIRHLRTVGKFDPTSRKRLRESQLRPNLAIKEAVEAYLREHGRA